MYYFAVLIISTCAGFFTGLLGVGGGIIIFPAFLFIFPLFGFESLDINHITGITSLQILSGTAFALLSRRRSDTLDVKSIIPIASNSAAGALIGSLISFYLHSTVLLCIYVFLLVVSFLSLVFIKIPESSGKIEGKNKTVNILCFFTGIISGAIGLGGAVLYIPILRYFYKISTKVTVNTVTFIVFLASIMTLLGKGMTGQIPYHIALLTIVGSFAGAKAGTIVSKKLSSSLLKKILLTIIVFAAIRVLISILWPNIT